MKNGPQSPFTMGAHFFYLTPEPIEVAVFDNITPDHLKEFQKDDPCLQKIRECSLFLER